MLSMLARNAVRAPARARSPDRADPFLRLLATDPGCRLERALLRYRQAGYVPRAARALLTPAAASEVASILESRISGDKAGADIQETGRVLTIGDGIARCVPRACPRARADRSQCVRIAKCAG